MAKRITLNRTHAEAASFALAYLIENAESASYDGDHDRETVAEARAALARLDKQLAE